MNTVVWKSPHYYWHPISVQKWIVRSRLCFTALMKALFPELIQDRMCLNKTNMELQLDTQGCAFSGYPRWILCMNGMSYQHLLWKSSLISGWSSVLIMINFFFSYWSFFMFNINEVFSHVYLGLACFLMSEAVHQQCPLCRRHSICISYFCKAISNVFSSMMFPD